MTLFCSEINEFSRDILGFSNVNIIVKLSLSKKKKKDKFSMVSIETHSIFKNTLLSDFFILESLLDLSDRANIVNLIIEDDRKENQVNRSKLYKGQLSCNV